MKGSVFKRCTRCNRRVKRRTCAKCGSSSYTWGFVVDVGRDAKGKRIQQARYGFATKADADRALQEVLTSVNDGTFVRRTDLTVTQFFLDVWLPATAPPRVKYATWLDRRSNIGTHVIPRIGDLRIQNVNAAHLNRMYADLQQSGKVAGDGGLSPTSVRRIHAMLRKACRDAVRWGLIKSDPTAQADPPPARVVRAARKSSMRTWSHRQLHTFLHSTSGHHQHRTWTFAAMTGVRRSELLGVRRSELLGVGLVDINFDRATCAVRRTVVHSKDGYRLEGAQKSDASARTIHLDSATMEMLRSLRAYHEQLRAAIGAGWNPHRLLFPRPDGAIWNPNAISHAFARAVKRSPVPRIRLHDLRHAHASLLLAAGVNPKVVSERLGHSSVAFTLDTYAHVMPGMQPEAAELFRRLVFEDPPSANDDGEAEDDGSGGEEDA